MQTLEPRVSRATPHSVARIARLQAGSGKVLSIYFDLDPKTFATPPARESQINSLLSDVAEKVGEAEGDEAALVRHDFEILREFLDPEADWAKNAAAAAIFLSTENRLFEVLKLPDSVDSQVVIDATPFVEPLLEIVTPGKWCVALINRRIARIFLGSPDWLREIPAVKDDVHGQHDQGGWSQARYQRSVEEDVADHLTHAGEVLMDLKKGGAFERLVVGAAPELWPEVKTKFHNDLLGVVTGRSELDVDNASLDEVRRELEEIFVVTDHEDEKVLLGRLRQELGTGGRASAGLESVLESLVEKRVEVLLIQEGFDDRGVACRTCEWAGVSADTCPIDGGPLDQDVDLTERAIELTLSGGGEVRTVRYHPDLEGVGSIAALLRY
jgi:peptide chain release factor subunit 1